MGHFNSRPGKTFQRQHPGPSDSQDLNKDAKSAHLQIGRAGLPDWKAGLVCKSCTTCCVRLSLAQLMTVQFATSHNSDVLHEIVSLHSPLAAYKHCTGTTNDTSVLLRRGWQLHAFKATASSHLMYLARKRLWKSLLMVSLMKRFCALGSPRDWLRNTTSSSHRLLTCTVCQASGIETSGLGKSRMENALQICCLTSTSEAACLSGQLLTNTTAGASDTAKRSSPLVKTTSGSSPCTASAAHSQATLPVTCQHAARQTSPPGNLPGL